MPVINDSTYRAPLFFSNPHISTVFPSLFRKVHGVIYRRERIETPDGDFLDIDVSPVAAARAAILLHGLEGDSTRSYIQGMARALNKNGWDAIAMNFRGCSGEPNRTLRLYHSGDTQDLDTVISHLAAKGNYSELALIGFSLGGNVALKYLGERGSAIHNLIKRAAVFSVPCDLETGALKISSPSNRLYMMRFLRMLREKIRAKMQIMPGLIDDSGYGQIRGFKEFDDRYTAPMHGFDSAEDYWRRSSSKQFLHRISVPTLLVNAEDDPFLSPECYPFEDARSNSNFFLEVPAHGGHVGFVSFNSGGQYWSESRAMAFLNSD